MPRFLFWNTAKKPLADLIRTLVIERDIDVLIVAELEGTPLALQNHLNAISPIYQYAPGNCAAVHFFAKFDASFFTQLKETRRYSIRSLSLPARNKILIVGVHLPSQMHSSPTDIGYSCSRLARDIADQEGLEGHSRTLLLGDLNLNPFHDGIVAADALHAVMSRTVALRGSRTVQEAECKFFYNPMWAFLNDRNSDTAGSFYYAKAQQVNYFWNTFDQVLMRPAFLNTFSHEKLEIIKLIGDLSLVDMRGLPDPLIGSDHLPIYLDLDF